MGVDGLEETEGNPSVAAEDVVVAAGPAVKQRASDCTGTKAHDLSGEHVLGSETKGCGVSVEYLGWIL